MRSWIISPLRVSQLNAEIIVRKMFTLPSSLLKYTNIKLISSHYQTINTATDGSHQDAISHWMVMICHHLTSLLWEQIQFTDRVKTFWFDSKWDLNDIWMTIKYLQLDNNWWTMTDEWQLFLHQILIYL